MVDDKNTYFALKPGIDMHGQPDMQPQLDAASRKLYDEVSPSVVQIFGSNRQESGAGTGFFIDKDGDVATAWHVVANMNQVDVVTADGTVLPAKIKTIDDVHDVAILSLGAKTPAKIQPLKLSDQDELKADDPEWALGHPRADKHTFISPGYFEDIRSFNAVLSANGKDAVDAAQRKLDSMTPNEKNDAKQALEQNLNAGIIHVEPGNSGGPVVNKNGEVVGLADMTSLGNSATEVVPVSYLKSLMTETTPKFTFSYHKVESDLLINHKAKDFEFILTDISRTGGGYKPPYTDPFLGGDKFDLDPRSEPKQFKS